MNARHPVIAILALAVSAALALPVDVAAQAAQPAQTQAGKITAVVPIVNVVRGAQQIPASTSAQVFWGDTINTGHLARARVTLDDGSLLSVGSDSNLTIAKHDAAEQQTDLDLNYGRVRARAAKLVKPNSHFQIRTSVGVAGVVGTEMIVMFETDGTMHVICVEGACRVCDNLGNCVLMKAGEETGVRNNQPPSQPANVTPMNMTQAVNSTASTGAAAGAGGIGALGGVAIGVGAAVAATVAVVVVRVATKTQTCSTPAPTGVMAGPQPACVKTGVPRTNGQRPM
jgi:hypothetical protein